MTITASTKNFLWTLLSRDGAYLGSGWTETVEQGVEAGIEKLRSLKRVFGTVGIRRDQAGVTLHRTSIRLAKGM